MNKLGNGIRRRNILFFSTRYARDVVRDFDIYHIYGVKYSLFFRQKILSASPV
jgi:hypothetical protein